MTTDPRDVAERAGAMTEEAPRDLATLTAHALDVVDVLGTIGRHDPETNRLAFQVQRLARQLAELAQHVAQVDAAVDVLR